MIRAILFDLDNTLIDRAAAFQRYATGLLSRRTSPQVDRNDILKRLITVDRSHQHKSFEEYALQVTHRCPELSWEPHDFLADYLPGLLSEIRPQPEIRALLEELRKRYILAIVTNGGSARQREKIERAKLREFFHRAHIFVSEEVGVRKPDPRIFEKALNAVSVAPEEALFCGDDARCDIAGAKQARMHACWVWNVHERSQYPAEYPAPDMKVRSLVELPAHLAGDLA